jgi:hypothetical protein
MTSVSSDGQPRPALVPRNEVSAFADPDNLVGQDLIRINAGIPFGRLIAEADRFVAMPSTFSRRITVLGDNPNEHGRASPQRKGKPRLFGRSGRHCL